VIMLASLPTQRRRLLRPKGADAQTKVDAPWDFLDFGLPPIRSAARSLDGMSSAATPSEVLDPVGPSRRDRLVDLGMFVLAVSLGLVLVDQSSVSRSDTLLAADLLVGSVACLALWWRRRWPVGVALVLAVPATFSDMSSGAVLIALFTVAVQRPRPVVAAVAGVHLVTLLTYLVLRPDPDAPFLLMLAIVLPLFAAVLAWGMFIRERRQLVESLRERARWVEAEQRLLVEQARQLERTRIAREMHDVLAHRISLLSMHAGALEFRPDASADEIAKAAGVIRDSAHLALQDLREVIGVLRQDPSGVVSQRPQPTLADLPALVEESRQAGAHVSTDYELPDLGEVPTAVGRNAYRIVQEGLTNARKHAPGSRVDVIVNGEAGAGLNVEVHSRASVGGARPSSIPGGGTGLVGLVERATLAGGRLEHGRTADGDFLLRAWLPWTE
jgi:signal transduction histidine kinase